LKKLEIVKFIKPKITKSKIDDFIEELKDEYHARINAATKPTQTEIYEIFVKTALNALKSYSETAVNKISEILTTSWMPGTALNLTLQGAVDQYKKTLTTTPMQLRSAGRRGILQAVLARTKGSRSSKTPKKTTTTTRKNRRPT
jgi:hypothetical protein